MITYCHACRCIQTEHAVSAMLSSLTTVMLTVSKDLTTFTKRVRIIMQKYISNAHCNGISKDMLNKHEHGNSFLS